MRQRIGIAQALLNDPQLLIVDEPTVGLDPEERVRFRNLLSDLGGERIVILSTHIVSDVEATATGIALIDQRAPARLRRAGGAAAPRRGAGLGVGDPERRAARGPRALEDQRHHPPRRRRPRPRVVGASRRRPDAVPVPPSLEDAYLAVLEGDRATGGGGMSQARVLCHLLRADFLERVRRYSFLVTLGLALYLGYVVSAGQLKLWVGDSRGVYNSAWVGVLMALVVNFFLSLAGFYVVKNAVERDRRTGRRADPRHHADVQAALHPGQGGEQLRGAPGHGGGARRDGASSPSSWRGRKTRCNVGQAAGADPRLLRPGDGPGGGVRRAFRDIPACAGASATWSGSSSGWA